MKRAGWAAAPMLIIPLPSAWRSVFSWCERARDLVGPGILEHPRLRHGLATAVRARVLDFFKRGFHAGGDWEGRWKFCIRIAPVLTFTRTVSWRVSATWRTER